jgi:hypothetical protein
LKIYLNILTASQRDALRRLGPLLRELGFYLGGGTGIALHLGHRRSVDLDWFTEVPMDDPLRLGRILREAGIGFITTASDRGTLYGTVKSVGITLLEYRYPLLRKTLSLQDLNCTLASLDDLACMKLAAIVQRGARKDFVDLYAILRKHAPLSRLLKLYERKFDLKNIINVLYALSYFDDAEQEPMPKMIWKMGWSTMKNFIQRQTFSLGKRI